MKLTSYKVTRHEDQFQLIWILVLAEPQRVILFVKVLPEIRQRDGPRVVVGVHAFPVLHIECSAHAHMQSHMCNKLWETAFQHVFRLIATIEYWYTKTELKLHFPIQILPDNHYVHIFWCIFYQLTLTKHYKQIIKKTVTRKDHNILSIY